MIQKLALWLGIVLIASGLLGASLTFASSSARAEEAERSQAHEQMHAMVDMLMGEGASERMHTAMPGSEEMMEACVTVMRGTMNMMRHHGEQR